MNFTLGLFLLTFSLGAFSWGKIGHEASAQIALDHLKPATIREIKKFYHLGGFIKGSTWPDMLRNFGDGWSHTMPYHYVNMSDNKTYFQNIRDYSPRRKKDGDAIYAIIKASFVLVDEQSSDELKRNALRFLIHIIGDIHQPLHVGRKSDLGGNSLFKRWFGKDSNIHSIWDSGILMGKLSLDFQENSSYVESSLNEYLESLPHISKTQKDDWSKAGIIDWLNESYKYRETAYRSRSLDQDTLIKRNYKLVDQRVQQAGIRLANYLNEIFELKSLRKIDFQLYNTMKSILGKDFLDTIDLDEKGGKYYKGLIFDADYDNSDLPICNHIHI